MSTLKVNTLSTVSGSGNIGFASGVGIDLSTATDVAIPAGTTVQRPSSPNQGSIRINTTSNKLEFYSTNTGWKQVDAEPVIETITGTGAGNWTVPSGVTSVSVLLIAGGGSGGSGTGGGGGGGGMVEVASFPVTSGASVPYNVGAGAQSPGTNGGYGYNGGNTSFGTLVAYGGGAIYPQGSFPAGSATQPGAPGASGPSGFGNPGEPGNYGGGGGAGAVGGASFGQNTGGAGRATNFAGSPVAYAGGGRGQANYPNPGPAPGSGGAGGCSGSVGQAGAINTGGGGGAGWDYGSGNGGAGGPGILIIKYT